MPYVNKAQHEADQSELRNHRAVGAGEQRAVETFQGISSIGEANGQRGGAAFLSGAGTLGGLEVAARTMGREAAKAALDRADRHDRLGM